MYTLLLLRTKNEDWRERDCLKRTCTPPRPRKAAVSVCCSDVCEVHSAVLRSLGARTRSGQRQLWRCASADVHTQTFHTAPPTRAALRRLSLHAARHHNCTHISHGSRSASTHTPAVERGQRSSRTIVTGSGGTHHVRRNLFFLVVELFFNFSAR